MKMTQALTSTVPFSSAKSDFCSRLFTTLFSFPDSAVKHASVLAPIGSSLLCEEVFLLHSSESVHTLIPYSSRYDFMIPLSPQTTSLLSVFEAANRVTD